MSECEFRPNLAKKVSSCSTSFKAFLTGSFSDLIFLNPVDESEIIRIAKTFSNGKATGYDGIPMSIIKQCIDIVSTPLAHIINLSISNGIVPDEMKIACVIPLYKSGDRELIVNYRPVSIERFIYNRLLNYIDKHGILCNSQYGFRKQHSTTLALIDMYDKISSSIDQRKCSVRVFLDLLKAFDTVNHDILLNKLDHYGICGLSLDWFKSYLTNRSQFVEFNGAISSSKFISCCVPQGSILGSLLFLLYINDLSKASDLVEFILFADDTNIFCADKDLYSLSIMLNNELHKISTWVKANILSINVDKTKFMIFKTRSKQLPHNFELYFDNHLVNQTGQLQFLGVILDEKLSWKPHISYITNKISKSIGIIRKYSFYLSKSSLRSLYYAMVYPYLHYCNIVWASTYKTNLQRIVRLHKWVKRMTP